MVRRSLAALVVSAIGLAIPQPASAQFGYSVGPVVTGTGAVFPGYGINAFNNRITVDPYLRGAAITAALADNTMYMRGTVPTLRAQLRARAIAESLYGINRYVDETRVVPSRPVPDAELQQKIQDEIFAARLADELNVDVSIDDGVVTLEADRLSRRHEQMLVDAISNLNGVLDVRVNTASRPMLSYSQAAAGTSRPTPDAGTAPASAPPLEQRVRMALVANSRVPASGVTVSVNGDTVYLSGKVGTLGEKRAAMNTAYVPGVLKVHAEDLMIADYTPPGDANRPNSRQERAPARPGDPPPRERPADSRTAGSAPNRAPADPSPDDRAGDANEAVVQQEPRRMQDPPSDAEVEQRVTQAVRGNPRLTRNDLTFDVSDRVVTVSGTVDTLAEQEELYSDIRLTRGVRDIDFNVDIDNVEDTPADLQSRVENRLTQLGLESLEVRTARGDVNLEGEVASLMLKRDIVAAVKDIPGVRSVVDNLSVADGEAGRPYIEDPYVDQPSAFDMITRDLTEPGDGSATPYGGGFAITGATDREVEAARDADLPDGVTAEGVAKRGRPLASPGANDAPAAEVTSALPGEEVADKLAPNVRRAIQFHPRLMEHDITIREVGEGRMVISGAVDDWFEYSLIRRLAYDAGATDVDMTVTVY